MLYDDKIDVSERIDVNKGKRIKREQYMSLMAFI